MDPAAYAAQHKLELFEDPQIEKPVYRKQGLKGIQSFDDMDHRLARYLRDHRRRSGLNQSEFAELIGLSTPVYGRYERAFSRLLVSRMVHVCEVLEISPLDMLFEIAPQFWGEEEGQARDRLELSELSRTMEPCTARELLAIARRLSQSRKVPADASLDKADGKDSAF